MDSEIEQVLDSLLDRATYEIVTVKGNGYIGQLTLRHITDNIYQYTYESKIPHVPSRTYMGPLGVQEPEETERLREYAKNIMYSIYPIHPDYPQHIWCYDITRGQYGDCPPIPESRVIDPAFYPLPTNFKYEV